MVVLKIDEQLENLLLGLLQGGEGRQEIHEDFDLRLSLRR